MPSRELACALGREGHVDLDHERQVLHRRRQLELGWRRRRRRAHREFESAIGHVEAAAAGARAERGEACEAMQQRHDGDRRARAWRLAQQDAQPARQLAH